MTCSICCVITNRFGKNHRAEAGMSGSPILNNVEEAVGIVAVTHSLPQPILSRNLPGWMLLR
jgi:hypothetical protein